jgi:cytochrome c oxidase subunit II
MRALWDNCHVRYAVQTLAVFCFPLTAFGQATRRSLSPTKLLAPASTWVQPIFELSLFVVSVTAAILIVGFALLAYSVVKFRMRREDDGRSRSNGSDQTGLAWTVIPILIVVAVFSASDRRS